MDLLDKSLLLRGLQGAWSHRSDLGDGLLWRVAQPEQGASRQGSALPSPASNERRYACLHWPASGSALQCAQLAQEWGHCDRLWLSDGPRSLAHWLHYQGGNIQLLGLSCSIKEIRVSTRCRAQPRKVAVQRGLRLAMQSWSTAQADRALSGPTLRLRLRARWAVELRAWALWQAVG